MIYTLGLNDEAVSTKQAHVGGVRTFNDRGDIRTLPVDKSEIQKATPQEEEEGA